MSAPKLSAFIICRNEASRIGATLAALSFADEIVVVDSGSSDGTQAIAREHGARVIERDWPGYGPQKVFAESQCTHDWLLNVDADEVVTPGLAGEIAALLASAPAPSAWRTRILNVYPGDRTPRALARDYNVVRLYHRAAGAYRDHKLFDRVVLKAGVKPRQLKAAIHHFPFLTFSDLVAKENRYTDFQAETAGDKPRPMLLLRLGVEAPLVFAKFYFLKGHILGGWKGFAFSMIVGFARMLRIVKLLERG